MPPLPTTINPKPGSDIADRIIVIIKLPIFAGNGERSRECKLPEQYPQTKN